MTSRLRLFVGLAALAFLVAHARTLPLTLEDIDSINFALGVESFDVPSHRPHPPGYPVYIAAAKASTAALQAVAPSWSRDRRAAVGLAIWSVIAGAIGVLVLTRFWIALGLAEAEAFFASLVTVASPLFWFTSARPLTDVPGLVAAAAVQTLLIQGLVLVREGRTDLPRAWIWGAAAAGLVIGLRSQAIWMNGPLLAWAAVELVARRRPVAALKLIAAACAGLLVWLVPLARDSGGPANYLLMLRRQGQLDFGGIEMLATSPRGDLLATGLRQTFVEPWHREGLAEAVLIAALLGAVALFLRRRRLLAILLVSFGPYLGFHLAFHETATLRYALPLVVPVAGLAVIGLSLMGRRVAAVGSAAIVAASLLFVLPQANTYARAGAPILRAFQDMQRALPAEPEPPALMMHHQVWHGVLRPIDWYRPYWDVGQQPFPGDREWLSIVAHWRAGETRPVWFLADLTRNDLRLFDRRSRQLKGRYEPSPGVLQLIGDDTRVDGLSWVAFSRPIWMLGTGWALTPEIAGMTATDRTGPHERPADAYVRRDAGPLLVMIGGRYLAPAGSPPGIVTVRLDGAPLTEWQVSGAAPWFMHWVDVPEGASAGPYSHMTVGVTAAEAGRAAPAIGLEQFDAARPGDVMVGYERDWNELEGNPDTGRQWRWTTNRSSMHIRNNAGDVRLTLEGESPLRNFDRAPTVIVRAGAAELSRFSPADDFQETIDIPASALAASKGQVTIETDLSFVPGERESSPDRRRLGLRLFRIEVTPR